MPPLAPGFSAMKARKLRTLMQRQLGYEVASTSGSHRKLKAPGRPTVMFAFADGDTIGAALVRDILVKQVQLSLTEAREVVARG